MNASDDNVYKFERHRFLGRVANFVYCIDCGLIDLPNEYSQWAVKMGCRNKLHSKNAFMRKKCATIQIEI